MIMALASRQADYVNSQILGARSASTAEAEDLAFKAQEKVPQ
jgi:hypothetical protein